MTTPVLPDLSDEERASVLVHPLPCALALEWLEGEGYTSLQAAWDACPCLDWLTWWLVFKTDLSDRQKWGLSLALLREAQLMRRAEGAPVLDLLAEVATGRRSPWDLDTLRVTQSPLVDSGPLESALWGSANGIANRSLSAVGHYLAQSQSYSARLCAFVKTLVPGPFPARSDAP